MSDVELTLAISDYEHVRDLTTGRVKPVGIRLVCLDLIIEEIFFRFTAFREWDVSEMSFAKYVSLRAAGDDTLTAIPVFPSRVCRQSAFYVRADGPERPEELAGGRIGIPEWVQTAGIYGRGWLAHDVGVPLADVEWVQAGVDQPGRVEKVKVDLPEGVRYRSEPTRSLNDLLLSGDVDAVMTAHPPDAIKKGDPRVRRLFPDYLPVEMDYFRRTGIFPIMHVIAMRKAAVEAHPWIAMNMFMAFEEAKNRSLARMQEITASRIPIPWGFYHADQLRDLLGDDPWPYGLEPNRRTLDAFLAYAFEQGVCVRRLEPDALFEPSTLSVFRI